MKNINHLLTDDSILLKNYIQNNQKDLITLTEINENILFKFYHEFKIIYESIDKKNFLISSKSNHVYKKSTSKKKRK